MISPEKYFPRYDRDLAPVEKEIQKYETVPTYLHYLPSPITESNKNVYYQCLFDHSDIELIVGEYIKTLVWTSNYYLNKCLDFEYYYPYHYAPMLIDLHNYLTVKDHSDLFPLHDPKPIHPYHQLMIILPKKSFGLLPPVFKKFLELDQFKTYFPEQFDLFYYGHRSTWECPPKIPLLDSKSTIKYYEFLSRHVDDILMMV